jgi:hypothetical protein
MAEETIVQLCMHICLHKSTFDGMLLAMKKGVIMGGSASKTRRVGHSPSKGQAFLFLGANGRRQRQGGAGVKEFCSSYSITHETFTRLTGFSPRAVANWVQGRKPSDSAQRRLTELNRLFQSLERVVEKEAIGRWLKESNLAFDGSSPLQVIERGESDRIWRMVSELESGEPG